MINLSERAFIQHPLRQRNRVAFYDEVHVKDRETQQQVAHDAADKVHAQAHLARGGQVLGLEPPHNLCKGRGALAGNYGQFGLAQLGECNQHPAAIFLIAVAFYESAAL